MLQLMNRFAHGYVLMPVLNVFLQKQILVTIEMSGMISVNQLVEQYHANEGHFRVALRLFQSLGWLEIDDQDALRMPVTDYKDFLSASIDKLLSFYDAGYCAALLEPNNIDSLLFWVDHSRKNHTNFEALYADMLDGPFMVTLLLFLHQNGMQVKPDKTIHFGKIDSRVKSILLDYFNYRGWVIHDQVSDLGRFIYERILNLSCTASYAPLLGRIDQLLFGDVDAALAERAGGVEQHVDRSLNVITSDFQYRQFSDLVEGFIDKRFNQLELHQQPRVIVDLGCGDGQLLQQIYHAIVKNTSRGKVLDTYPLLMVGVDRHLVALDMARKTLKDIPSLLIKCDDSNPTDLVKTLKNHGIKDPRECLYVRSFLDDEMVYCRAKDQKQFAMRVKQYMDGVFVSSTGESISYTEIMQRYVEHMIGWANVINDHGLIVLGVHSLPPQLVSLYFDEVESFLFDATQAFSRQYLLMANDFILAAAEAGLFCRHDFSERFPASSPFARISMNWFEKKTHQIRLATMNDLERLIEIEQVCWSNSLQVGPAILEKRLSQPFNENYVIIMGAQVVGVLYTQRIKSQELLYQTPYSDIESLSAKEGRIAQLITINVHPSFQHLNISTVLLSFALQRFSFKVDIDSIVAVTRCHQYASRKQSITYEAYVDAHTKQESVVDPMLAFHLSHGAIIRGIVRRYRDKDVDNCGHGVLIEYSRQSAEKGGSVRLDIKEKPASLSYEVIEKKMFCLISSQLVKKNSDRYHKEASFHDMGFDSMDLVELRHAINKQFNVIVDATVFFYHANPVKLAGHLFAMLEKSQVTASS